VTDNDGTGNTAAMVIAAARDAGLTVAAAESLTAGMVCAALAEVPGASAALQGGVVAYQGSVKVSLLGVDPDLLARQGAVNPEVAAQMAAGACAALGADIAVATTGAAGPEPHDGKPVGTVFVSVASDNVSSVQEFRFDGDRADVRAAASRAALESLYDVLRTTR
jgi:nicotinamide-nucleotide amidase